MITLYKSLKQTSLLGIFFLFLLSFSFCGGGNNNNLTADDVDFDLGTGSGNAAADTTNTILAAGGTAGEAMTQVTGGDGTSLVKAATTSVNDTYTCDGGGNATISGTADDGNALSISLALEFNNCVSEGVTLNGNLTFEATIETDEANNLTGVTFTYGGNVGGNGCLVIFDGLTAEVSVDSITDEAIGTMSGQVISDCESSGTVVCDFGSGTDFNDSAAMEGACS